MKQFMAGVLLVCMAATSPSASAADQADKAKVDKLLKDVDFCYGVSALAASTVQLRNQGQTKDEQLERRKTSLSDGQYALVADITEQVYAKDLRDVFVVAGDTNADCLRAKDQGQAFTPKGLKGCPQIGLMKAEVDAMRRRGVSANDTVAALKERYGGIRTALGESLKDMARSEPKGDQPDSGAFENQMCMIVSMTGQ